MPGHVKVKFSCNTCGIRQQEVLVPARQDKDDLKDWLDATRLAVEVHHQVLSGECASDKVDLMIPVENEDPKAWIGREMP